MATSPARADDPAPAERARAKDAYDRGVEARKGGDARRAAEQFARADAIVPSTTALQAALDAAIEADDVPLGAELLERSKREPPPPTLASSITSAHFKFADRAGRVKVICPTGAHCSAKIDDRPVDVDRVVWAAAGPRGVTVVVDGSPHAKVVDVTPDQVVEVTLGSKALGAAAVVSSRPPSADETAAGAEPSAATAHAHAHDESRGLPRAVFYTGVAVTATMAASALYFALDTSSQHKKFRDDGCTTANYTPCADVRTRGQDSQTATNVSLVLALLAGAGTAAIGLAFTDWTGPALAASPSGAVASFRGRF